jgi:hypothetical protein
MGSSVERSCALADALWKSGGPFYRQTGIAAVLLYPKVMYQNINIVDRHILFCNTGQAR